MFFPLCLYSLITVLLRNRTEFKILERVLSLEFRVKSLYGHRKKHTPAADAACACLTACCLLPASCECLEVTVEANVAHNRCDPHVGDRIGVLLATSSQSISPDFGEFLSMENDSDCSSANASSIGELLSMIDSLNDCSPDKHRVTDVLPNGVASSFLPPSSAEETRSCRSDEAQSPASLLDLNTAELDQLLDHLLKGSPQGKMLGDDISASLNGYKEPNENDNNVYAHATAPGTAAVTKVKQRCIRLVIGGPTAVRGHKNSSFSKCVCDNIRCLQCNFSVLAFSAHRWRDDMDHVFLRTFLNPKDANICNSKLATKLESNADSTAYCCQCAFTAVGGDEEGEREISPYDGALRWSCSGH